MQSAVFAPLGTGNAISSEIPSSANLLPSFGSTIQTVPVHEGSKTVQFNLASNTDSSGPSQLGATSLGTVGNLSGDSTNSALPGAPPPPSVTELTIGNPSVTNNTVRTEVASGKVSLAMAEEMLKGKTLASILSMFDNVLSKDIQDFKGMGYEISQRDRFIINSGNRILHSKCDIEKSIDMAKETNKQLQNIKKQQDEMECMLVDFEEQVSTMYQKFSVDFIDVDKEREAAYQDVALLMSEIYLLRQRVNKMIHDYNTASSKQYGDISPLVNLIEIQAQVLRGLLVKIEEVDHEVTCLTQLA